MGIFFKDSRQEQQEYEIEKEKGGLLGGMGTLVLLGTAAVILYDPVRRAVGQFIHRQLENVLSLALGADVRFERLRASIFNGRVEAEGMSITRKGMSEPLLTVRRLRAQTALSRALRGELVLESLDMVRPVLRIIRHVDRHTNIPSRLQIDPARAPQKAEELLEVAEQAGEALDRMGLRLDVEHAMVTDGEVHFIDESAEGFHVAATGIIKEMGRSPEGHYEFCGLVRSVGRRDQLGELGEVRFSGRIDNIDDLTQIARARLTTAVEIGDQLRVDLRCPVIESRRIEMHIDGSADMASFHPLIPPNIPALEPLRAMSGQGRMTLRTSLIYDPNQGINLSDLQGAESSGSPQQGGQQA
jgi:hypothetical protein